MMKSLVSRHENSSVDLGNCKSVDQFLHAVIRLAEAKGEDQNRWGSFWIMIDPELPAAKFCMAGMQAEGAGDAAEARRCFEQAWDASTTPYEKAISAHYVARHQDSPEDELMWNQRALDNARAVDGDGAAGFMPSLIGCVGIALEKLGRDEEARARFDEAESHFHVLSDDAYGDMVRAMVAKGRERLDRRLT